MNTTYKIIDLKTKKQIGQDYTWKRRNWARGRADRLNLDYGAHRYFAKPVFDTKGEVNLLGIVGLVYLGILLVILLTIF